MHLARPAGLGGLRPGGNAPRGRAGARAYLPRPEQVAQDRLCFRKCGAGAVAAALAGGACEGASVGGLPLGRRRRRQVMTRGKDGRDAGAVANLHETTVGDEANPRRAEPRPGGGDVRHRNAGLRRHELEDGGLKSGAG